MATNPNPSPNPRLETLLLYDNMSVSLLFYVRESNASNPNPRS